MFVLLADCQHVIESQALEMHFNINDPSSEIVLKGCPLCKTPVTKTLRFSNYLKKIYNDILMIKTKIYGSLETLDGQKNKLFEKLVEVFPILEEFKIIDLLEVPKSILPIVKSLEDDKSIDQGELHTFDFMLAITSSISSRLEDISKLSDELSSKIKFKINRLFEKASDSVWMSEQQKEDISLELSRYHRILDLYIIEDHPQFKYGKTLPKVANIYTGIKDYLFHVSRYSEQRDNTIKGLMKDLRKQVDMAGTVTDDEKRMVHEAMKTDFHRGATGHWFTCPNGHYYCITECGGAMQRARCPMDGCGAEIGGERHRIDETSRLASDMDGASRPAWGEGFDMANFNLNDLI